MGGVGSDHGGQIGGSMGARVHDASPRGGPGYGNTASGKLLAMLGQGPQANLSLSNNPNDGMPGMPGLGPPGAPGMNPVGMNKEEVKFDMSEFPVLANMSGGGPSPGDDAGLRPLAGGIRFNQVGAFNQVGPDQMRADRSDFAMTHEDFPALGGGGPSAGGGGSSNHGNGDAVGPGASSDNVVGGSHFGKDQEYHSDLKGGENPLSGFSVQNLAAGAKMHAEGDGKGTPVRVVVDGFLTLRG